jgi:hypothetical protein
MTETGGKSIRGTALFRWLFAAAFVLAVALSGLFTGLMNRTGLFFLVFGSAAAALMGFTWREIGAAFRQAAGRRGENGSVARSACFWEAAARNAWILGAMGSALNFTFALSRTSGGIEDVGTRMIQSFIVFLYGLVLAIVCLVPATKLYGQAERDSLSREARPGSESGDVPRKDTRTMFPDRIIGYVLLAALLVLTVIFLINGQTEAGPLPAVKLLLHGPAYLVVFGGAIALALFMGPGAGARAWTAGFSMTGLVGLLMGLIQALFGFAHKDIAEISSAVAFIISASLLALLGVVAVAAPLEDREVMEGRRAGPAALSRMSWILLPLLTFIFLILTFIMVVTPMKRPG